MKNENASIRLNEKRADGVKSRVLITPRMYAAAARTRKIALNGSAR